MPFLRFSRDKRGYETTALVHAFRRQNRSKILYWFRTPVDARIGRAALDEEAIRLLEEHHPDVSFDWPKILELTPPIDAAEVGKREARPAERRRGDRRRPRRDQPGAVEPADTAASAPEADDETLQAEATAETHPLAPTAETEAAREAEALPHGSMSSAQSTFSPEDLARLRGRHAALLARIDEEVADPEKAVALRVGAEALNPDTWVTAEDVREALEHYERVYRELREALGKRQRRRRPSRGSDDHDPPQVV